MKLNVLHGKNKTNLNIRPKWTGKWTSTFEQSESKMKEKGYQVGLVESVANDLDVHLVHVLLVDAAHEERSWKNLILKSHC